VIPKALPGGGAAKKTCRRAARPSLTDARAWVALTVAWAALIAGHLSYLA
jgi:hypothetical protein